MGRVSALPLPFCNNAGVFIVVYSLLSISACVSQFLLGSLETCGIFLHDFTPYTSEQGDVIHEIIKHLHLNQRRLQSVIVKNAVSQREVHTNIFKSMKYGCFLYAHINFGQDLFSTIPSFSDSLQRTLYKKALFLIFVKDNADKMLTSESSKLQRDRQYTIFVSRIYMIQNFNQLRTKILLFHKTYFFCPFCEHSLVQLDSTNTTNILSINLLSYKKSWATGLAQHYDKANNAEVLKSEEYCRQENAHIIMYEKNPRCQIDSIIIQMIVFASGSNVTVKQYVSKYPDDSKIPQIYTYCTYAGYQAREKYSSLILREHECPSIIYCYNLGKVTMAETNMWTKYVPNNVWALVGLCLLLSAILNATDGLHAKPDKSLSKSFVLFVNSFLKLINILWRQSWSHKLKLLASLELLFITLISLYENSITVSVVAPLIPRPLSNTIELYNNNFTFVVERQFSTTVYNWLSDEYNTVNYPRVLKAKDFNLLDTWLEELFLGHGSQKKYAIVGFLYKYYHFRAVLYVKERNDTCYQLYPTEGEFYSTPFYFLFLSPVAPSLQTGALLVHAHGFLAMIEKSQNFIINFGVLDFTRPLLAKYDKDINNLDLKNNRLKENLITLGNIKSVLYIGLVLFLSSSVTFVAEICSKNIYFLMFN